jgi:hypothetical protein
MAQWERAVATLDTRAWSQRIFLIHLVIEVKI